MSTYQDHISDVAREIAERIIDNKDNIRKIALEIAEVLVQKDKEYGGSWIRRGGVGAFMMKLRKSDRLEEQTKRRGYDIFAALADRSTSEDLGDTLLDDAGYAILILAEAKARGILKGSS